MVIIGAKKENISYKKYIYHMKHIHILLRDVIVI